MHIPELGEVGGALPVVRVEGEARHVGVDGGEEGEEGVAVQGEGGG